MEIKTCEQYVLAELSSVQETIEEIKAIVKQKGLSSTEKVELIENILNLAKGE